MISISKSNRFAVRKGVNAAGAALGILCVVLALIPLVAMMGYVLQHGGSSLNWAFFSQLPNPVGESGGGMSNAILGTLLLIALTSLIGVPVGILGGIYLSRSRDVGLAHVVRFVTDVIAGTPSIVAGIVAYALVVVPFGFSAISGSVALALLMFPTVTRATEEAIKLVPTTVREAALALGLPEWKSVVKIILPAASTGIVTAIMLGVARVAGETAPLLFTAFGNPDIQWSPTHTVEALPVQIWEYATQPYENAHRLAWEGALVLFGIIVILNISARLLTRRLRTRVGAS
jgi:phosphate transport system permease protein